MHRFARLLILLLFATALACAPDPHAGKVEIRYMAWGNPEQQALEQAFCEKFNRENPDIHVKFFRVPGSAYKNKMIVMLASRTAPDVIRVDNYDFPALARKDYFLNMSPLVESDPTFDPTAFYDLAYQEGHYKGSLYGMGVLFGGYVIYYNKTLFERAGLTDPNELVARGEWTFEKFREYAVALTRWDENERPTQFGTQIQNYPFFSPFIWGFGGDVLNQDRTRCVIDSPEAVAGLQFLADLRWKDRCTPTPSQAANSAFNFESGRLGMSMDWMGMAPRYRNSVKDFEWDICPLPSGPVSDTTIVKGNQLVISSETRHPQEAWRFVKFMTSEEVELELYGRMRRCFPTRKSVAHSKEFLDGSLPPASTHVFLDSVDKGRALPITERWSEWTTAMNTELDALWSGRERDAGVVARRAAAKVNTVLSDEEGF